ncbi:DUF924 domain-containing protein [Sulfitobacter mediterraneus]|jgi:uncharacterized protein (DUF924 family)|uniref:DUF924 family protein n=1 Tax=Sulfitobacter TaxID=60136 RepID=UPI001932FF9A|nr:MULTISPECIES: DUF924 family protein [Sulfitobacter]MBM1631793.1 DUF924 domain-containing protein [Sulfitobacter mediterraneus]MBM1639608.1 DUF924 domain-containing protein [Sulfitobacter mediterraneus]MBM1643657.1 DUF924 domain-containing protein [Sulfitobacter mediterraneus]MBM1647703.1 DUF924 domain-containing protein [Sulfitobacter mediterraneus]MBM1651748.1 DUF924 domain-containing protein [Sulfitobacter mediterraneus]
MVGPEEILEFWLDEIGPKGWYEASDALDSQIRDRFHETWQAACEGKFSLWLTYPSGALAYIILMDQFPRNMFRGSGEAFASDRIALTAAKAAINKGWDLRIDEPARQFFYLPLMHSENLCDQERCVRLMCERMPQNREGNLLHARAHREVIRKFGRFPYRNDALSRTPTQLETAYVANGGYGATVRELQADMQAA